MNHGAWMGVPEYVKLAAKHGASAAEPAKFWAGDWPPLQHALFRRRLEVANLLIELGAPIDAHEAAGLGDLQRLRGLIEADPECVHARGGDGATPLHFANDPATVDLLLEHGAKIDLPCVDHHSTPAQWAVADRPDVALHLIDRGAEVDIFMLTAIGDVERLRAYLAKNPDATGERITRERFPMPRDDIAPLYFFTRGMGQNATPLHVAAGWNRADLVPILVEAGADPNARGAFDDGIALHTAAWCDAIEAADALIAAESNIELESGSAHQNPPLGWAITAGSVGVVKRLLAAGANVRDTYREVAMKGAAGEFREYATGELDRYQEIIRILDAAGR
jgi:ankyrin repeat protein